MPDFGWNRGVQRIKANNICLIYARRDLAFRVSPSFQGTLGIFGAYKLLHFYMFYTVRDAASEINQIYRYKDF